MIYSDFINHRINYRIIHMANQRGENLIRYKIKVLFLAKEQS